MLVEYRREVNPPPQIFCLGGKGGGAENDQFWDPLSTGGGTKFFLSIYIYNQIYPLFIAKKIASGAHYLT